MPFAAAGVAEDKKDGHHEVFWVVLEFTIAGAPGAPACAAGAPKRDPSVFASGSNPNHERQLPLPPRILLARVLRDLLDLGIFN